MPNRIVPKNPPRFMVFIIVFFCVQFLSIPNHRLCADELLIGDFSKQDVTKGLPPKWQPLLFPKIERHTEYSLINDPSVGTVIRAVSENAASGLIYRQRIDPDRFAILQWQWKVDHVLKKGDLRSKQGDDYAARIYVAFAFEPDKATWWQQLRHKSASLLAGQELPGTALNYIWANQAPIGTIAPNAYAEETMMIAVQSGPERCGQWLTEKRNLVEDYRQAFKRAPPEIIGIALMTDTDNTGEAAVAYYGDIVLQAVSK
ncbi:MAG: DUF3047 domain-containing protein [Desulfobacteraceae bacterium]|nr:DUF3047 domain-containing protein [Desulfobacteraceae bacterium]